MALTIIAELLLVAEQMPFPVPAAGTISLLWLRLSNSGLKIMSIFSNHRGHNSSLRVNKLNSPF